jgi:hypothetical protein
MHIYINMWTLYISLHYYYYTTTTTILLLYCYITILLYYNYYHHYYTSVLLHSYTLYISTLRLIDANCMTDLVSPLRTKHLIARTRSPACDV